MSTENAKIRIRNRLVELKLTFQYAQHMMENYMGEPETHDLNFVEIQRLAKKAEYKHLYKRIWEGLAERNNKIYRIILILERKFAVIKTCYFVQYVKKGKKTGN